MKNNLPTNQLEAQKTKVFVQKMDDVFMKVLKQKCFERVVFFQPELANISRIGKYELDTNLFPYLVKNISVSMEKQEKAAVWASIEKSVFVTTHSSVHRSHRDFLNQKPKNKFERLLALQSIVVKADSIFKKSKIKFIQESFWRLKVKYDQVDETKLFLISMLPLIKTLENRRVGLFVSDTKRINKINKKTEPALEIINAFFRLRTSSQKKESLQEIDRHKRVCDLYERLYSEDFVDVRASCLRIISEFDKRPNGFSSLVKNRPDYLRFLLLVKILHDVSISKVKRDANKEFFYCLKTLHKNHRAKEEKVSRFVKMIQSFVNNRKRGTLEAINQVPTNFKVKSRVLISQVIEKVNIKQVKKYPFRDLHTFCLLLQEVINFRRRTAMTIIEAYAVRVPVAKNQKILYARVEHLKKLPTLGSFVLPEATQMISMTPRGNQSATMNNFHSPMTNNKIGMFISVLAGFSETRDKCFQNVSKRHGEVDSKRYKDNEFESPYYAGSKKLSYDEIPTRFSGVFCL
jgi:hypothetical protein